ncbi:hypothetical protein ACU635_57160 [[Actinomadura] parvosata]|uniref:hypothetical protein n=1 Tax=[Actinomadura] parvosata TaxID=1955412 RepID=UPI00406BE2C5
MVGLVGGPVLGGALIAWFWWGAVFVINVPIAALAVAAALTLMPESKGPWRKADPVGMARVGARAQIVTGLTVMAAGFALLAVATPARGLAFPLAGLLLIGAGGGTAMPAAIAALMGRVPAEHAGVGSALNDTIQQMGAALGVAVLGSVLAAGYGAAMPATAAAAARRSIADALAAARLTGDPTLAEAARDAFTAAMSSAFAISAAGALAAAVLALIVLRDGRTPAAPHPTTTDAPERELAPAPSTTTDTPEREPAPATRS